MTPAISTPQHYLWPKQRILKMPPPRLARLVLLLAAIVCACSAQPAAPASKPPSPPPKPQPPPPPTEPPAQPAQAAREPASTPYRAKPVPIEDLESVADQTGDALTIPIETQPGWQLMRATYYGGPP